MPLVESPDDLIIELLNTDHELERFSCGEGKLNRYLKRHALQNTLFGYGRTYVAVRPGDRVVLAYVTLVAAHVDASCFPTAEGCPEFIAVVNIGRLAVDVSVKGVGVSYKMMGFAFDLCFQVSSLIGTHAIVLDAKTERLVRYYRKFGFIPLMDDPLHLYLPINQIGAAVAEVQAPPAVEAELSAGEEG